MPIRPIRPLPAAPTSLPVGKAAVISRPYVQARTRVRRKPVISSPATETNPATEAATEPVKVKKPKATKGTKPKKEKKQPKGDYEVGYGKPPKDKQFDGSSPGPGRPKGSVSQDKLLKKHLTQVRPVTIEGKLTKVQARELLVMMQLNAALKGEKHATAFALTHSFRLFGDGDNGGSSVPGMPAVPVDMDAHDHAILAALKQSLLEQGGSGSDEAPPLRRAQELRP